MTFNWRDFAYRLLSRGRVALVDDAGLIQRLQVRSIQDEASPGLTDGVPRVVEYGLTSNPPAGTDAVVLYLSGDRRNGVVMGTHHAASRPTGLAPGETMLFTDLGQRVYLSRSGIVVEGAGLPVTVNANTIINGNTTINGTLHTTGAATFDQTVAATGNITSAAQVADATGTLDALRSHHNAHTHTVSGVDTGSGSVQSGGPSE